MDEIVLASVSVVAIATITSAAHRISGFAIDADNSDFEEFLRIHPGFRIIRNISGGKLFQKNFFGKGAMDPIFHTNTHAIYHCIHTYTHTRTHAHTYTNLTYHYTATSIHIPYPPYNYPTTSLLHTLHHTTKSLYPPTTKTKTIMTTHYLHKHINYYCYCYYYYYHHYHHY